MYFSSSTAVVALATLQLIPGVFTSPYISADPAPAANGITAPRDIQLIGRDGDKDDIHDVYLKDDDDHQVQASLEKIFGIIHSIPNEVLEKGDDELDKWLVEHGHRSSKKKPPTRRDTIQRRTPENIQDFAERSFWDVARCVGAIAAFIASNAIGAAKIFRIKKYIEALGGIREAAELLLRASTTAERLKEGGEALALLAGEILGTSSVANNCTWFEVDIEYAGGYNG